MLPKPTSDGPVYENMAYHLSVGHGFWIDWHDPQWREPYEQSAERDDFQVYLDAPSQSMADDMQAARCFRLWLGSSTSLLSAVRQLLRSCEYLRLYAWLLPVRLPWQMPRPCWPRSKCVDASSQVGRLELDAPPQLC